MHQNGKIIMENIDGDLFNFDKFYDNPQPAINRFVKYILSNKKYNLNAIILYFLCLGKHLKVIEDLYLM